MPSSVSIRRSIRWLPGEATEPTHTIVLTEDTGMFLDVRFKKDTNVLDWAFAGYRHQITANTVQFVHHIDSRTLVVDNSKLQIQLPLLVVDIGKNTTLANGQVLESGKMVNPESGEMTHYEEIWEDITTTPESSNPPSTFVKNDTGTTWQAQVGDWQIALGRRPDGTFWAWQATYLLASPEQKKKSWKVVHATEDITGIDVLEN